MAAYITDIGNVFPATDESRNDALDEQEHSLERWGPASRLTSSVPKLIPSVCWRSFRFISTFPLRQNLQLKLITTRKIPKHLMHISESNQPKNSKQSRTHKKPMNPQSRSARRAELDEASVGPGQVASRDLRGGHKSSVLGSKAGSGVSLPSMVVCNSRTPLQSCLQRAQRQARIHKNSLQINLPLQDALPAEPPRRGFHESTGLFRSGFACRQFLHSW